MSAIHHEHNFRRFRAATLGSSPRLPVKEPSSRGSFLRGVRQPGWGKECACATSRGRGPRAGLEGRKSWRWN